MIDRNLEARFLGLIHWTGERWSVIHEVRCLDGMRLRSTLESRARELRGPSRILDAFGRRGCVAAVAAALPAPDVAGASAPASAGADPRDKQLSLFPGVKL